MRAVDKLSSSALRASLIEIGDLRGTLTRGDLLLDVLLKYSSAHPHILQLNFADLGLGTQITSINLVENNEELYRFWSAYKAE